MGRLSTFAKNRILNLRFQKCYRIKQIAQTLLQEDSIKVSRKSISTFLKKYIETKSINDKPRSGRNKKLTPEEINLIGEVTRLNRDITAPKIKEYLNLNVSTYTILRASKLFEWNKFNPNSNQAKKQAAMQRKMITPGSTSSGEEIITETKPSNTNGKRGGSRKKKNLKNSSLINTNESSLMGEEEEACGGGGGGGGGDESMVKSSLDASTSNLSMHEMDNQIEEDTKINSKQISLI
jgi:transposase